MRHNASWAERQLTMYKSEHQNLINEIFHVIGISTILFSTILLINLLPRIGYEAVSIITGGVIALLFILNPIRGIGIGLLLVALYLFTSVPWRHRDELLWCVFVLELMVILLLFITCFVALKYTNFSWKEAGVLFGLAKACALLMIVLHWYTSYSWQFAIALFISGWAYQFAGHVFERKPPAFTKNKWSLLIALLWLGEVVIGYRLWNRKEG